MVKVEEDELEQIVDEANDIRTFIKETTDALQIIIEDHDKIHEYFKMIIPTLKEMEHKQTLIWKSINGVAQKEVKEKEPVYRKASPGFDISRGPVIERVGPERPEVLRRVVEYTKKDGTEGFKIVGGDVIFEKQAFKYLQECKYGCGNYISFDNYKKGQKALHITQDLEVIGRYCPKYE